MKFENLIQDLQGNPNLIATFIANPKEVLDEYALSNDERSAILSGDMATLTNVGVNNNLAAGVLSGAHTPSCSPVTTRP